jgi:hypothetical protein
MYSRVRKGVNVLICRGFASLLASLALAAGPFAAPQEPAGSSAQFRCDPALSRLFAPRHPQWGRYEVCVTAAPLGSVADPAWSREEMAPFDALGGAGDYDRAAVARLYGAARPLVARGWTMQNGALEAVTLISPYPDATATHLESGTLIIRLIICCL